MSLRLEPYRPELYDPLIRFYRLVYPHRDWRRYEAVWRWQYFQNPRETDPHQAIILITDGPQIVAHLGAMANWVWLAGQRTFSRWSCDLVIHPEYRNRGLAIQLLRAWTAQSELAVAMGIEDHAWGLFHRLGFTPVNLPARGRMFLSPAYPLARLNAPAWATAVVDSLLRPARLLPETFPTCLTRCGDLTARRWTRFSPDLSAHLASLPRGSLSLVRDPDYLNWRFADSPACAYRIFGLYDSHNLVGYMVLGVGTLAPGPKLGRIFDMQFFQPSPRRFAQALRIALAWLDRLGAHHCLHFPPVPQYASHLWKLGFRPHPPMKMAVFSSAFSPAALAPLASTAYVQPGDNDAW